VELFLALTVSRRPGVPNEHHHVPIGCEAVRGRGPDAGARTRDDDYTAGIMLFTSFLFLCRIGPEQLFCPVAEA
jgi:hypothetical protein